MTGPDVVMGQFAARNRYATECGHCSVLVRPDHGIVCEDRTVGPLVLCVTCVTLRDNPHAVIGQETAGAGRWVTIQLLGFARDCWQCGTQVACIAGMYPHRPGRAAHRIILAHDDAGYGMGIAEALLKRIGRRDIASTIQWRHSQTRDAETLAVVCGDCGEIQGNFFVCQETQQRYLSHGLPGFDVLGLVPCRSAEWQKIVHDPDLSWMLLGG